MKQLGECTKHIKNINSVWVLWFNMLWMPPCRFSRPGRVAAVPSSNGDFPPAGRYTQHPLQKQSCGDFPHQHRCKWACLLIGSAWKKKRRTDRIERQVQHDFMSVDDSKWLKFHRVAGEIHATNMAPDRYMEDHQSVQPEMFGDQTSGSFLQKVSWSCHGNCALWMNGCNLTSLLPFSKQWTSWWHRVHTVMMAHTQTAAAHMWLTGCTFSCSEQTQFRICP